MSAPFHLMTGKRGISSEIHGLVALLLTLFLIIFFQTHENMSHSSARSGDFKIHNLNFSAPFRSVKPMRRENGSMAILINVHISAKDGKQFPTSQMQCVGVSTFVLTRKSHKMDLIFFHNHKGTLECPGMEKWEGVRFVQITLGWFEAQVAKLNINARTYWPQGPHNALVCDFKPLYAHIFSEYITNYPFWAYGDVDGVFGHTDLFSNALWRRYDIISSYCNTNHEHHPPLGEYERNCRKGFASGPLTILRKTQITKTVIDYALDNYWRELFKIPKKKQLDEQYGGWPNFNRVLLNHSKPEFPVPHLNQYCRNICHTIQRHDDLFVFNLIVKSTDEIPLKFRWTADGGTWLYVNNTKIYRIHFLHWSHWKYVHDLETKASIKKLFDNILHLECFELHTKPPRLELC